MSFFIWLFLFGYQMQFQRGFCLFHYKRVFRLSFNPHAPPPPAPGRGEGHLMQQAF